MRALLLILILVTLQNLASASTNAEFASVIDDKTEKAELLKMNEKENFEMNECVKDAMSDDDTYEVDFY